MRISGIQRAPPSKKGFRISASSICAQSPFSIWPTLQGQRLSQGLLWQCHAGRALPVLLATSARIESRRFMTSMPSTRSEATLLLQQPLPRSRCRVDSLPPRAGREASQRTPRTKPFKRAASHWWAVPRPAFCLGSPMGSHFGR